jgi:hypothetical protein
MVDISKTEYTPPIQFVASSYSDTYSQHLLQAFLRHLLVAIQTGVKLNLPHKLLVQVKKVK